MIYVQIWFLCKYDLSVNMNHGRIWNMGAYDSCANMNYSWWLIIGEYELLVNMNFGQISILLHFGVTDNSIYSILVSPTTALLA